jgi:predicted lipoprotein with Yx(FWY)xxD motif
MNRLLSAGAAVVAGLTLAACGGGGGQTSGSPGTAGPGGGTTLSVEQSGDFGRVLVDSAGRPLYVSDQETGGKVLCTGACTSFWIPFTVDAGAPTGSPVSDELGVVVRPDGTRQVTYDGKLLYSFFEDQSGQITGDGFADAFDGRQFTWHVVRVDAASSSSEGGRTGGPNPSGY